jgi:hypothetical protein
VIPPSTGGGGGELQSRERSFQRNDKQTLASPPKSLLKLAHPDRCGLFWAMACLRGQRGR